MKKEVSFITSIVVFIVVSLFVLVNFELVNAQCESTDSDGPVVELDSSFLSDQVIETNEEKIDIMGTVTDGCFVKEMTFEVNPGSDNPQSGTPTGEIKDWSFGNIMKIDWKVSKIQLNEGENKLSLTATDIFDNTTQIDTKIIYTPEVFDGTEGNAIIEKHKSTWYDDLDTDRFSINALIYSDQVISAICGDTPSPIKVELEAQRPDGTYFTMYTLNVDPANEPVSCNNYKGKFRYKNRSEKGVYDFRMYTAKENTKFYLYVVDQNFGNERGNFDTVYDYMVFISSLKGVKLTLRIGGEVQYTAEVLHDYCQKYEKDDTVISKVECHVKR